MDGSKEMDEVSPAELLSGNVVTSVTFGGTYVQIVGQSHHGDCSRRFQLRFAGRVAAEAGDQAVAPREFRDAIDQCAFLISLVDDEIIQCAIGREGLHIRFKAGSGLSIERRTEREEVADLEVYDVAPDFSESLSGLWSI